MSARVVSARRRRRQGGSVIIEMGLCLIALFFMIFAIVQYSQIAYMNNFCSYAAQQGARYASVRGSGSSTAIATSPSPCGSSCTNITSGDPTTTYIKSLGVALNPANLTVATTWSSTTGSGNAAGGTVTVKVTYAYSPFLSVVTASLPSTFNMNATSTMTVLQ
jgi:Flp pilus assembly protein TadG